MSIFDVLKYGAFMGGAGGTGGGSGGGAQPDMNAAPGEPGHILNRTHWKEVGKPVEILAETNVPYNEENDSYFTFAKELPQVGSTATVIWNGVSYSCTVYDVSLMEPGAVAFGNLYKVAGEDVSAIGIPPVDTGEPFAIMCTSVDDEVYLNPVPLEEIASLTLGISTVSVTYHKIPQEYLQDTTKLAYMDFTISEDGDACTTFVTPSLVKSWLADGKYIVARYNYADDIYGYVPSAMVSKNSEIMTFRGVVAPIAQINVMTITAMATNGLNVPYQCGYEIKAIATL